MNPTTKTPVAEAIEQAYSKSVVDTLNEGQLEAVTKLVKWVDSSIPVVKIDAPAGTGKTYTIGALEELLPNVPFLYTAPTNKAANVLSKSIGKEVVTTFSALGLTMSIETQEKTLAVHTSVIKKLKGVAVLVVDEWSYIDAYMKVDAEGVHTLDQSHEAKESGKWKLMNYLMDTAKQAGFKVLLLGDKLQLPPPSSDTPEAPLTKLKIPTLTLTEVMRNSGNLLAYAVEFRKSVESGFLMLPDSKKYGIEIIPNYFSRQIFIDAPRYASRDLVLLAWRNATVDKANKLIRRQLWGEGCASLVMGDSITFTQPAVDTETYKDLKTPVTNPLQWASKTKFKPCIATDDLATVLSCKEGMFHQVKVWIATVKVEGGSNAEIMLLHPDGEAMYKAIRGHLANQAKTGYSSSKMWAIYHNFSQAIAPLKFSYALTAHRSQGSTFPNTLILRDDILANRDSMVAYKCLYVAATRASISLTYGGMK